MEANWNFVPFSELEGVKITTLDHIPTFFSMIIQPQIRVTLQHRICRYFTLVLVSAKKKTLNRIKNLFKKADVDEKKFYIICRLLLQFSFVE